MIIFSIAISARMHKKLLRLPFNVWSDRASFRTGYAMRGGVRFSCLWLLLRWAVICLHMGVTKPYEFAGFGAMAVTKPYEFIRFGAMAVTKPYEFIGFGAGNNRGPD